MAATDARPVPRKNAAWRVYFAVRKNDGTLITTWAGQDSEVSLDGAAFADCTNEATEVGTSGCGYLDLTSSEMNADEITLKITVTNTDALPLVLTVFPEEAGDYRVADTQKVDVETIKTQSVTAAAGITIPASIASPTNITAATGIVLSGVTHTGAVIPTVSTLSGHTAQTGDSFARIGVNGAGLTTLATAAQIAAMTVNTRANYQVPIEIELPDSSTQVFKIRLHLFDSEGNMEAPDSTPTIALTNAAGTDRSSRLSAASNPSTGVYSWDYTATAGDAEEQLVWVFTVVEGALTRTYPATSYVVEESAYRFSSTDRATLNAAATQVSVNDVPTVAEFEARTLAAASYATAAAIAAEAVKTAAIKATTDQLTFTTPNKVDSTAVLDPAVRVKLDGTQPDYAPATATALTTVGNNVTAILEDTGTTIPTQITALNNLSSAQVVSALGTGTWATALPWNAAWDAEVQSEVQDAIEVNNLDHLVKIAVDTNFATTVHLDSVIGHMADNGTTATFSRTTDSLEAIRDNQTAGSGASLSDIIAGVQSVSGAIVEAQNSATLSIRIGDTWTQDIESLGDLTDKTVSFALKKRASDADTAAIVFIVEGTGLTKLNGAATTAGWGSITILDEVAGDIRLRLESNATSLLTSGSYVDAVKVLENGDDRTLRNAGRTVVSAGVIADIT